MDAKESGPIFYLIAQVDPVGKLKIKVRQLVGLLKCQILQRFSIEQFVNNLLLHIKTGKIILEVEDINRQRLLLNQVFFLCFENVGEQGKIFAFLFCFEDEFCGLIGFRGVMIGNNEYFSIRF